MADGGQPPALARWHAQRKQELREACLAAYARMMQHVWINPVTRCWIFGGTTDSHGYGSTRVKINGKWRVIGTHLLSYIVHNGRKPKRGWQARHRCDIRPCVCPDHLVAGTRSQNMRDMMERNRGKHQFQRKEAAAAEPSNCPF